MLEVLRDPREDVGRLGFANVPGEPSCVERGVDWTRRRKSVLFMIHCRKEPACIVTGSRGRRQKGYSNRNKESTVADVKQTEHAVMGFCLSF